MSTRTRANAHVHSDTRTRNGETTRASTHARTQHGGTATTRTHAQARAHTTFDVHTRMEPGRHFHLFRAANERNVMLLFFFLEGQTD